MRSLFWLLVVFAAAVALVIVGRIESGYVLLIYPPYRVEVSMLFFAIALVAGFGLLYALIRLLGHALSLPAYVRSYRARRRRERAHAALSSALQAYYEGRYSRAEKEAAVAFEGGSAPALAALLAARSAHQLRDFQRRDRLLDRAAAEGARVASAAPIWLPSRADRLPRSRRSSRPARPTSCATSSVATVGWTAPTRRASACTARPSPRARSWRSRIATSPPHATRCATCTASGRSRSRRRACCCAPSAAPAPGTRSCA